MPIIKDEDGAPIFVSEDSEEFKLHMFHVERNNQIEINSHKKSNKMKNSKITSCNYSREWQGPSGTIYYHNIALENGDAGSVGTKEKMPDKLAIGQEIWYDIEQKGVFKGVPQHTIKLQKTPDQQYQKSYQSKPNTMNQSNSNQQESIARSVALKAAIDAVGAGEQPATYVNVALYFEHYLLTGQQANQDAVDSSITDKKMDASSDDLPF
mgnify:CR=1 FL=1